VAAAPGAQTHGTEIATSTSTQAHAAIPRHGQAIHRDTRYATTRHVSPPCGLVSGTGRHWWMTSRP